MHVFSSRELATAKTWSAESPAAFRDCVTASPASSRRTRSSYSRPSKKRFKAYPIGYFHVDIAEVLTDNGTQFTFPPRYADGPTARYATHMFDLRCQKNGIEHRLTKIKHPWTTDVIDKSFLRRTALCSRGARATARQRAGREVKVLPRSLYRRSSFAAPVRAFGPLGFQPATNRA